MIDDMQEQPAREPIYFSAPRETVVGFVQFLRERGVTGFAMGFILGGGAQKLVQALMDDIINPLMGMFGGPVKHFSDYTIGEFKIGEFTLVLINFIILCFVVYLIFKMFRLEKLDKPKEEGK